MRGRKKRGTRKVGKIEPPLTPLAGLLADHFPAVAPPAPTPDPEGAFRTFVGREPLDLDARSIGNWADLAMAYQNALVGEKTPIDLARKLEELQRPVPERANAAAHNTIVASKLIDSAMLMHLRPERWHDQVALAISRIALETAGRAVLIAHGTRDEPERYEQGDGFEAAACIAALKRPLASDSRATPPDLVYAWLCRFGHMNYAATRLWFDDHDELALKAYAGIAYVSWATAKATEVVTGLSGLAKWPDNMPSPLPWTVG